MSATIDETLIRDVVSEVLNRLAGGSGSNGSPATPPRQATPTAAGVDGIYQDVGQAVAAAKTAQQRLVAATLKARGEAIECIRKICIEQAEELARYELDESGIGRLDHKIEKLLVIGRSIPGMEMLTTEAVSGLAIEAT